MKVVNQYDILTNVQIGIGNFATVCKGYDRDNKIDVAVKVLSKTQVEMNDQYMDAFQRELQSLKAIESNNVVKLLDFVVTEDQFFIIQELCQCDLRRDICKQPWRSEQQALACLDDLGVGFMDMLTKNIVHRDLKPQNILVKDGHLKICDFGVAQKLTHFKCCMNEPVGSITYMSPQVLNGDVYTYKCDIWSIGVIFYELLHGYNPWYVNGDTRQSLLYKISTVPLKTKQNLSLVVKQFLKKCLQFQEKDRLSYSQFYRYTVSQRKYKEFVLQEERLNKKINKIASSLKRYFKQHKTDLFKVLSSLGISSTESLSNEELRTVLNLVEHKISKEQLNYCFMQIDQNCDGEIEPVNFSYFIQGDGRVDSIIRDISEVDSCDYQNSQLARSQSQKHASLAGSHQQGFSSLHLFHSMSDKFGFKTLQKAVDDSIYQNLKLAIACRSISESIKTKGINFSQFILKYQKYNSVSIFSNQNKKDLLGYEGFQKLVCKHNQHLKRQQIRNLFDFLHIKGGKPYLSEKNKQKYMAINIVQLEKLITKMNKMHQNTEFDLTGSKSSWVQKIQNKLSFSSSNKAFSSKTLPSEINDWKVGFQNKDAKTRVSQSEDFPLTNLSHSVSDKVSSSVQFRRQTGDSTNKFKNFNSLNIKKDFTKFKSQKIIIEENNDDWAV